MSNLSRHDFQGLMAMMPAFATPDASDWRATETVDGPGMVRALDRMIGDGVDLVATTGSFGEGYALLPGEFDTLVSATIDAVAGRVPVVVGCVGANGRELLRRAILARDRGADVVLLGLPNYFPMTVDNALRFFREAAEQLAPLPIMIYHNPLLHRTFLPAAAFGQLLESKNIMAMKDSHRTTRDMIELMAVADGRLRVFVFAGQYHPYAALGAAGLWSIDCWMGPAPLLALLRAVADGDNERAVKITREVTNAPASGDAPDLAWRETASKLAIAKAGYCDPGPLRFPFVEVPQTITERVTRRASYWQELEERYRAELGHSVDPR